MQRNQLHMKSLKQLLAITISLIGLITFANASFNPDEWESIEPIYDNNGNVTELLDGNTGEIVGRYEYDPYGNTTKIEGKAAQENKIRFSTKEYDETSGLYYYGYRHYDPVTGRWPSRDPIEEYGGWNMYGMVGNNAINRRDRLGLNWVESSRQFGQLGGDIHLSFQTLKRTEYNLWTFVGTCKYCIETKYEQKVENVRRNFGDVVQYYDSESKVLQDEAKAKKSALEAEAEEYTVIGHSYSAAAAGFTVLSITALSTGVGAPLAAYYGELAAVAGAGAVLSYGMATLKQSEADGVVIPSLTTMTGTENVFSQDISIPLGPEGLVSFKIVSLALCESGPGNPPIL